jgi:type II secretory pathway pseudopilin PulG
MGFHASRDRLQRRRHTLGFTLPEVVIAGAILALFVAGSVATMVQINRWAAAARLRTLALALAQQKSDEVLTTPWQIRATRPAVLATGTNTESGLQLNNDSFNSATGLSSAFTTLDTPVVATRTTQLTDISTRMVRAVITVNFTYRTRPYSVSLTTLRVTDDI